MRAAARATDEKRMIVSRRNISLALAWGHQPRDGWMPVEDAPDTESARTIATAGSSRLCATAPLGVAWAASSARTCERSMAATLVRLR